MVPELLCWHCGASLAEIPLPISRHANCEKCFEVLHCCRMCRHYEPDRRPYCGHERAEPPVEKESANFCDYFKPANRYESEGTEMAGRARHNLAALFGESPDPDATSAPDDHGHADHPRSRLDDLFDD